MLSAHLLAHSMGLSVPEYDQAMQERKAKQDPLYDVDLYAEYDLIIQKKSKLTRSQRERVVHSVESRRARTELSPSQIKKSRLERRKFKNHRGELDRRSGHSFGAGADKQKECRRMNGRDSNRREQNK